LIVVAIGVNNVAESTEASCSFEDRSSVISVEITVVVVVVAVVVVVDNILVLLVIEGVVDGDDERVDDG
jgi:hypothetical protein